MRRRLLGLFVLVLAVVVGFNTYSIMKVGKEVVGLSEKAVTGNAVAEQKELAPLDVIIIEHSQCDKCSDLKKVVDSLKSQLNIKEVNVLNENTGSTLVKKYNLKRLPVVIFSKEMASYADIAARWDLFGSVAEDGSYLLTNANPPFMDLETGEVQGLVKLTNLVDKSCAECYNVASHKLILKNLGMGIASEETVDVASDEGKALVAKYKIESVPSIILSKEASVYQLFNQAWASVGSKEEDGSYVYRNNAVLQGKYMNLLTGKVEGEEAQQPAADTQEPVPEGAEPLP